MKKVSIAVAVAAVLVIAAVVQGQSKTDPILTNWQPNGQRPTTRRMEPNSPGSTLKTRCICRQISR